MKAFFAVGDSHTAYRLLHGRRILISFAYVGSSWLPRRDVPELAAAASEVLIDSGAFTAWRSGKPIELGRYVDWLSTEAPAASGAFVLDVIGDAEASARNHARMRELLPPWRDRLVPVWHEGDPLEHLDEYVARASIVGLGRIEGRRSELKTLDFYDLAFNRHPNARFHALGNASPSTLEPYPFTSFDSTTWQRDAAYSNAAKWPYNRCSRDTRMRAHVEAAETIVHRPATQLRITWNTCLAES